MSSMRVLVTEDEKRLAAALKREFDAEGFKVDVALDSQMEATTTSSRYM